MKEKLNAINAIFFKNPSGSFAALSDKFLCLFGKMQCLFSGFAFIRLSLRMEISAKSLFIIEI